MRKFASVGAAALLVISAIAGVSYAQDTATPEPSTSEVAAPAVAQRAWLGIRVNDEGDGVTITQVSANSPAEAAQLQVGDVITAVNDTQIDTLSDLQAVIEAAASGDVVTLTVERGTEQLSVDVTLGSRVGRGLRLASDPLMAAEHMLNADLETVDGGYQVVSVDDNSSFDLAAGDVITAVNGEAITSADWMTLVDPASDNAVTLTVQRDGAEVSVEGQLALFGRRGGFPGNNGQPGDNHGQRGGFPGNNGQLGDNNQPNDNGGQQLPPDGGQPGGNGNVV